MRIRMMKAAVPVTLGLMLGLGGQAPAQAQGRRAADGPPPSARAAAPVDFTGYWQSIVTDEDWVYRMVTPRPGDHAGVPLTTAGIQMMDAWDPARDTAAGEQCKSYGAPAFMRVPGHLRISWQDDQTLKVELDSGQQTRLFHFVQSDAAKGAPSLQGYSVAQWELQRRAGPFGAPGGAAAWGALKVTTDNLTGGYLRKNGVPYSAKAQMVEFLDLVKDDTEGLGDGLLVVTSSVTDPVYLFQPFVTDDNFLKLPSDAEWEPSACSATW